VAKEDETHALAESLTEKALEQETETAGLRMELSLAQTSREDAVEEAKRLRVELKENATLLSRYFDAFARYFDAL
jgi:hypothetical protein